MSRSARWASDLQRWWTSHGRMVLLVLVAAMALEATAYLLYELWRLVIEHGWKGATDLGHRLRETHAWFAGRPVYGRLAGAVYPPATYPLLWPLLGWLALGTARWLWAPVTLAGLAWFVVLIVREARPSTALERAAIVLALLAIYPTGQTIGNGQLMLVVLPLLLVGLFSLQRPPRGLRADLVPAFLLLLSMVKLSAVVPFLVLAALAPWRKRPLVLAGGAYVGLTVFAALFQTRGLPRLIHDWLKAASDLATQHTSANYGNVHAWLTAAGLKSAILPVSVVILAAFAYWTWRNRTADVWILIGVAAYVSRLWTYHRSYDDLLIVLPMVALFRLAKRDPGAERGAVAGLLLALTLAVMLWPGGEFGLPGALRYPFTSVEAIVWLAGLAFLGLEAGADAAARRRSEVPASDRAPAPSARRTSSNLRSGMGSGRGSPRADG